MIGNDLVNNLSRIKKLVVITMDHKYLNTRQSNEKTWEIGWQLSIELNDVLSDEGKLYDAIVNRRKVILLKASDCPFCPPNALEFGFLRLQNQTIKLGFYVLLL